MSVHARPVERAWYRQPMVWMIIAIPLSSVVVGMVMLWLSIVSYDGLVADDYYKRGLEINRVLDRDRAAQRAGLAGELEIGVAGSRLALAARAADHALPATVTLELSHATRAGRDRRIVLGAITPGDYAGQALTLEPGRYYVQVSAADWRLSGALDVPGSGRLALAAPAPP